MLKYMAKLNRTLGLKKNGYLSLDCSLKLKVFREAYTVRFAKQITANKNPCIFSRQMMAVILYMSRDNERVRLF